MMFNGPRVNDDQIVLSAKADLAKVQQLIAEGQWARAQDQLAEVSSSVQAVNDGGRRQDLMDEVNLLNTKVESRNPNATLPPGALPHSQAVTPPGPAVNTWIPLVPGTEPPTPPSAVEPPTSSGSRTAPRHRRRPVRRPRPLRLRLLRRGQCQHHFSISEHHWKLVILGAETTAVPVVADADLAGRGGDISRSGAGHVNPTRRRGPNPPSPAAQTSGQAAPTTTAASPIPVGVQ